jgi:hypothetical protein
MSAPGVVSIAFAKTGFVLLCNVLSETLPPGGNDPIEMPEDYPAQLAPQTRRAAILEIIHNIEVVRVRPVLAPGISLTACTWIGSAPSFE